MIRLRIRNVVCVLLVALVLLAVPVTAHGLGSSTKVVTNNAGKVIKVTDDFSTLVDRDPFAPPSSAVPYFVADTIYSGGFAYGYNTNTVANITTATEGKTKYAHFVINTDPGWNDASPSYILADIQDGPSGGNNANGFLRWKPTVGNPVVVKFDMRLPRCTAAGTGCGTGSAGLVLWNGPILADGTISPQYKSIGFNFASADSDRLAGLTVGTVWNLYPTTIYPISQVNPGVWNNYKMVWTQNVNGSQTVKYYINGVLYGTDAFTASEALELGALGTENWLDNYAHVTFLADGTVTVTYANVVPGQPRAMDMTNYVVKYKDTDN